MINDDFTDAQRAVLDKVEKLLRLAGKNSNEEEAQAATAKAMKMLEEHNLNLDAVDVEGSGDKSGKRAKERLSGGFYQFERDLWCAVAHLNFCWYWTSWRWERRDVTKRYTYQGEKRSFTTQKETKRWEHVLVGRVVNIKATQIMAQYLLQTARRITKERLHNDNTQMLSAWAISFQEGLCDRVIEKLEDRRHQILSEERERQRAAAKMAMDGSSSATGLTLGTRLQQENDANADFLYGEGWSAKQAAKRAHEAMLNRMSEEEYTQWAAANPEEARERAEAERRAKRQRASSGPTPRQKDWSAYKAGHLAGASVSIDPQAGSTTIAGRLK